MLNFKDYRKASLNEAVKVADSMKVAKLITTYLTKKVGKAYLYPSIEQYKHGADIYTSITVLLSSVKFVRFNWLHGKLDQKSLHSVTIMDTGVKKEVTFNRDIPLIQTLPQIVNILKHKETHTEFEFYLEESVEDESIVLTEAKGDNPLDVIKGHIVTAAKSGQKIAVSSLGLTGLEYKLLRQLVADNPNAFDGYRVVNAAVIKWHGVETTLANSNVKVNVATDKTKETWIKPTDIDETEAEDQITYIEKIEDLSNMLKFMVKGATNAVFVAGRGGTGKTQTVEDTLGELGMEDGNGYFKVTGSASPAAIYETLYKNKKGIILFDDCDGALDSQDGRNLIKAATDTKSTRKVSWLKKSSAYYDPMTDGDLNDGSDEDDGESDIGDKLPRYFDFTGKVVFISNLNMRKLDPDGALKTRGMMIELNPSNVEMYQYMELIYNKVRLSGSNELSKEKRKEVIVTLRDVISKSPENTVNLRLLVRALNLAATGLPDWGRMLRYA